MSWILFLSITGIILLCMEVFLPGAVLGVVGGICLLVAVIITYVLFGVDAGNAAFLALVIGSAAALFAWIKFFPRTRFGKVLITSRNLSDSKSADSHQELMGQTGRALTPLRPSGTAQIGNQRVDVVAETGLIDPESQIKVIQVDGSRVVVRKI